jgi:hypothetical protein
VSEAWNHAILGLPSSVFWFWLLAAWPAGSRARARRAACGPHQHHGHGRSTMMMECCPGG